MCFVIFCSLVCDLHPPYISTLMSQSFQPRDIADMMTDSLIYISTMQSVDTSMKSPDTPIKFSSPPPPSSPLPSSPPSPPPSPLSSSPPSPPPPPPPRFPRNAGCIVLGSGNADIEYTTRYYIDHAHQTKNLCSEVLLEDCVPCCHHHNRNSGRVSIMVWSFISSEAFIYFLHVTSIVFGCFKEAYGVNGNDPVITMVHSSIETGATLLLLVIRMINGRRSVPTVLKALQAVDYVNPAAVAEAHVKSLHLLVILHTVASLVLIAICVAVFLLSGLVFHMMTWTILSNNFCMITTTMLSGLLVTRVAITVSCIKLDQHRVILYDALLLMWKDSLTVATTSGKPLTTTDRQTSISDKRTSTFDRQTSNIDRTMSFTDKQMSVNDRQMSAAEKQMIENNRFVLALRKTKPFYNPPHIRQDEDTESQVLLVIDK